MSTNALGNAGKVFFGSLCVGTFGLGVWQSKRYNEKIQLIEERTRELQAEPIDYTKVLDQSIGVSPFQRLRFQGRFRHDLEFLVGPRSPPVSQGMSQQGYYVMTPLILDNQSKDIVIVNRGWIPQRKVLFPSSENRNYRGANNREKTTSSSTSPSENASSWWSGWFHKTGSVPVVGLSSFVAVSSPSEQPKYLVAEHKLGASPPQLYWFDRSAMKDLVKAHEHSQLTVVTALSDDDSTIDTYTIDSKNSRGSSSHSYKLAQPSIKQIGKFKTDPAIHVGYAVTWYGLSLAGVYMTRKLILKR